MDFTLDQLMEACRKLRDNPSDLIEFFYGPENREDVIGKVRFMNTAGGMQFCFKTVSERGESSGMYFATDSVESLGKSVIRYIDLCAGMERHALRRDGYLPVSQMFEVRFRFVPEYTTLGHQNPVDLDDMDFMEGAETITLTLPEKK